MKISIKKKYRILYSVEGVSSMLPLRITVEEEDTEKAKSLALKKISFLSMYKNKKITIHGCVESKPVSFIN